MKGWFNPSYRLLQILQKSHHHAECIGYIYWFYSGGQ